MAFKGFKPESQIDEAALGKLINLDKIKEVFGLLC
jgi:hypothetical protein